MFSQRRDATSDTSNGHHHVGSRVARLMNLRSPNTVERLSVPAVIAVVMNSFKSPSFFAVAHVFKKVRKRFPTLADLYSSASIIIKGFVIWVGASLYHSTPYAIEPSVGPSMSGVSSDCGLSNQAAARFGFSALKRVAFYPSGITAVAQAFADGLVAAFVKVARRVCDYFELSKTLTDEGFFGRHIIAFFNGLFSSRNPATTGPCCDTMTLIN